MQDKDEETGLEGLAERPNGKIRPSSYGLIYGPYRRRPERIWLKAVLLVGLMLALGWSLLRLARAGG
ncbi:MULTISPECIES: hypothetical protein [unclassified Variovorax]|uniref:hypothetical protein n=1 Tax=unclassified Variovorax TaxID=663243 RepID=UPI00076BE5F1|nr:MULTISPECIES: hypothetical protein [unclassified Variovorax]KWT68260.1 hypothetical protein APY03_7092 [Variovorax sp. WDL1]PNG49045.1 hypothetical protein CHC06_06282 [Variovorax sp. B2]PNG49430.1 hypothetical protein CHC07_06339 [Variovorax sp. B4]VTV18950.1 hypothetical protein WDL1P2_00558 [Variovorax sp. WDL1]